MVVPGRHRLHEQEQARGGGGEHGQGSPENHPHRIAAEFRWHRGCKGPRTRTTSPRERARGANARRKDPGTRPPPRAGGGRHRGGPPLRHRRRPRHPPAEVRARASPTCGRTAGPCGDAPPLARIRSLAIPPAWTDVWICPTPDGHLQATGRDARGRKQYRYHPRWREVARRGEVRPDDRLRPGAAAASAAASRRDLARPGLPREKVLAAVVRLLETTLIRVGNEEYAQAEHSYGLTTLRDRARRRRRRRASASSSAARAACEHEIDLDDRAAAPRSSSRCQDLPGQELFQYLDDDGEARDVELRRRQRLPARDRGRGVHRQGLPHLGGHGAGGLRAAQRESRRSTRKARRKRTSSRAVEAVAKRLGNTPAVCRKCYVHPAVFDAYLDGVATGGAGPGEPLVTPPPDRRPEQTRIVGAAPAGEAPGVRAA